MGKGNHKCTQRACSKSFVESFIFWYTQEKKYLHSTWGYTSDPATPNLRTQYLQHTLDRVGSWAKDWSKDTIPQGTGPRSFHLLMILTYWDVEVKNSKIHQHTEPFSSTTSITTSVNQLMKFTMPNIDVF
jgi:hypothetical protein